jgi:signal transduction histidine kinase
MRGDSSLLFEAVSNLIDNALKFTPPGGSVTLRTMSTADRQVIDVSDTGPGIAPGEREAVMRRFYRAEESRHTSGSGLGLTLVAAVARLHNMDLTIADEPVGCRIMLARSGMTEREVA